MSDANPDTGAIVLAAGLSLRMGKAKMLLPWGGEDCPGDCYRNLVVRRDIPPGRCPWG